MQFSVEFGRKQTLKLKPKAEEYLENCALPEDTVDEMDINQLNQSGDPIVTLI